MTKAKNTKRALLSSVLALVVCIAMLVGSTFAWFTDNATTSGNTIVSGKLDVALEMEENGAWVNAEGKTLKWITEDQVANVLWEPGCTYKLPKLRVVNNGNLALKYKVVISGLEGDTKLLDAIDFTGIPTENEYVELKKKGDNVEFQIEGHMKEEAGNEYMDLELSGISITVYATQLNYENDSYGPNYDEGLDVDVDDNGMFKTKNDVIYYYPENGGLVLYKVTDDYTEATLNIPEGVTAIGKAAFTVPTTLKKVVFPSTVTSIGYKPFKGSAVEEVVLNEGLTELPEHAFNNAANLKKVNIPSTVKKLNKQAFYACGLTEITIPASVEYIGQNAFASSPNLKTVTIEGKNVTIENNAFRGCSSLETVILLSDSVTLGSGMIFTNTESNNENPNNITVYVISDAVKQTLENNADFKGTVKTLPTVADGLYYDNQSNYYVTSANGITEVANQVNSVAQYAPNIFKGKTVKLLEDIDLGGVEWSPIGNFGNTSNQFDGIFDGQGHTVSNFKITAKSTDSKNRSSYGFFGNVNGTVKNLTVSGAAIDINGGKFAAALIGRLNGGLVENCHVVDSAVTIYNWTAAGLVSQVNAGNIKNCSVTGTTITGYAAIGGIVGIRLSSGETTIENCLVKNCKLVSNGDFGGDYTKMFGLVLGATYDGGATVNINNCTVESNTIKNEASSVVCGYVESGDTVNIK